MFSTKVAGILAILSFVLLVGVVMLQVVELNSYSAAPSLWP